MRVQGEAGGQLDQPECQARAATPRPEHRHQEPLAFGCQERRYRIQAHPQRVQLLSSLLQL